MRWADPAVVGDLTIPLSIVGTNDPLSVVAPGYLLELVGLRGLHYPWGTVPGEGR